MRKWIRVLVVAAVVALPFVGVGPDARADDPQGGLQVEVPGIIRVCVRFNTQCGQ